MAHPNRTVSLVLGSGGARGLAHIGVIDWLTENGYEIRSIAGSSMGAMIGGIYAAGKLDVYTRWVLALQRLDVIRLLDLSFGSTGLFKGERVIGVLKELIGDRNIEDLPVPFTAVATDIQNGKEVWLSRGPLFDAIRASMAIPTIFTPHTIEGRQLVDGGLVNPIPIAPTLRDRTDLTVVVNASAPPAGDLATPLLGEDPDDDATGIYRQRIVKFIAELTHRRKVKKEEMGLFDILSRSMDTMQDLIARFQLAAYSPDVVIEIPRDVCSVYEMYRARELIELGRARANTMLGRP
ncbi:MAG: alpha/beta hydrolase fold protein [Deltaproteobacteria bacterium CSP1-8]|nr:MAG: alpha/beta hydrolase fold protein [Deltaproteobacteria bacterium CSP1-8]